MENSRLSIEAPSAAAGDASHLQAPSAVMEAIAPSLQQAREAGELVGEVQAALVATGYRDRLEAGIEDFLQAQASPAVMQAAEQHGAAIAAVILEDRRRTISSIGLEVAILTPAPYCSLLAAGWGPLEAIAAVPAALLLAIAHHIIK